MSVALLFPDDELYPDPELYPGAGLPELVARGAQYLAAAGALTGTDADLYLLGILEAMLAPAEHIGQAAWGSQRGVGRAMLDPEVCAPWALSTAAQVVLAPMPVRNPGEELVPFLARARDAILFPPSRSVGSRGAIRAAARPFLTGTRALRIVRRMPDEFHFQVRVRSDEVLAGAEDALAAAIDNDFILEAGQKPELVIVDPGTPWIVGELLEDYAGHTIAELLADWEDRTIAEFIDNPGGV